MCYAAGGLVQMHSVPGKGHAMISGPAEMRHLMAFWAQSLKHRPVQAETGQSSTLVEVHGGAQTLSSLQTKHA